MSAERILLDSGTPATVVSGGAAEGVGGGGAPRRGVVVLPDVFGLSPVFVGIAERLAADLSATVGVLEPFPGLEDMAFPDKVTIGIRELGEERILSDALLLADLLDVEPVALLGVCIGGMFALRSSAGGRFDRVVSLYGMVHVPDRWKGGGKGDPLESVLAAASTPILAIAGTEDEFVPVAHLDELERVGVDVHRVEGASHGFAHDPSRPNHDADAAKRVWETIDGFLAVDAPTP